MDYGEALGFLYGLTRFGVRLGLEIAERLASCLGHPEKHLRFIHVAGTNGKGSTCAFLESIYREAGLRVGLYTSPHLISFRERIQVNRELIPEADVAQITSELRSGWASLGIEEHPTFFEFVTVVALEWFRRQRCDLVIWETGMGGRLDATNIVTPLASVITNIGWDHMQWLGSTLADIAREKAGIIKPGIPVITAEEEPEALNVLMEASRSQGSPLRVVSAEDAETAWVRSVSLPLEGPYQYSNAALAVATVSALEPALPVTRADMIRGLQKTRWSGRFEAIEWRGQTLILDGAHNRSAFAALAQALQSKYPGRGYALLLGMLADKDQASAAELLLPQASRVVAVPIQTARAGDPATLAQMCRDKAGNRPVEQTASLEAAFELLSREPLVVVTGSLYLIGETLELISGTTISERKLNDWSRTR